MFVSKALENTIIAFYNAGLKDSYSNYMEATCTRISSYVDLAASSLYLNDRFIFQFDSSLPESREGSRFLGSIPTNHEIMSTLDSLDLNLLVSHLWDVGGVLFDVQQISCFLSSTISVPTVSPGIPMTLPSELPTTSPTENPTSAPTLTGATSPPTVTPLETPAPTASPGSPSGSPTTLPPALPTTFPTGIQTAAPTLTGAISPPTVTPVETPAPTFAPVQTATTGDCEFTVNLDLQIDFIGDELAACNNFDSEAEIWETIAGAITGAQADVGVNFQTGTEYFDEVQKLGLFVRRLQTIPSSCSPRLQTEVCNTNTFQQCRWGCISAYGQGAACNTLTVDTFKQLEDDVTAALVRYINFKNEACLGEPDKLNVVIRAVKEAHEAPIEIEAFGQLIPTSQVYLDICVGSTGSIPSEFGFLTELTYLTLTCERTTGTIPSELGLMTSLSYLDFYHNQLFGAIPSELGLLSSLSHLSVGLNQLTKAVPTELGLLTSLTYLGLFYNLLTGSIPPEFSLLTSLSHLDLSSNTWRGVVPTELGLLTSLSLLDLNRAMLSGTIPSVLGLMTAMSYIDLSNNQLTGGIPTELGLLTVMDSLILKVNSLAGMVPQEICSLSNCRIDVSSTGLFCPPISCGRVCTETLGIG